MFPENHGLAAMLVTSCIKDACSNLSLSNIIVKGDEIIRACDLHNNETVTLRKHSTKYKNMRKWMVEFFRKSESYGHTISRDNSIRITKSIDLL